MIKAQLTYKLWVFGAAALDAISNVENDQAIAPIGEIGQSVFDLQIMQVTTNDFTIAINGSNRGRYCAGNFPTGHFFRMLYISEINYAHRARRVIRQVHIMPVDERAMDASS